MADHEGLVGGGGYSEGSRAGESAEEQIAVLLDMCRTDDGKASVKAFFDELQKMGIRQSDPRLSHMNKMLYSLSTLPTLENLKLDPLTFKTVLSENIVFITKAFQNRLIIPAFETFCENITDIYNKLKVDCSGEVDTFLPQLAQIGADKFGISVCTVDGQRFSIGDVQDPFSMQSICKPISYGITLNELSEEVVHKYQGREPSGRNFNEIVLDHNNKPFNPFVNSGGLMSASLLVQMVKPELDDLARKYEYVLNIFERMAGREMVEFNNSIFLTAKTSVDRDFSLAYFMRENKCFPPGADIKKILEFYFQMTSLEMNCESNSVMAASLANGGTCPITGERILKTEAVNHVLALMSSCGMSIYSGQFAFNIGMPAMSAVSGAIMLVVPNVMGITIYSPRLDRIYNSVRGVQFCQELQSIYQFHKFDGVGVGCGSKLDPTLKKSYTANELGIQLLFAAANGDIVYLRRAFLSDLDLNMSDYDGRTALHLACAEGHLECVTFLLEICKVDPEAMDRWDQTPLSESMRHHHLVIARYLKEYIDHHPTQSKDSADGHPYEAEDQLDEAEDEDEQDDPHQMTTTLVDVRRTVEMFDRRSRSPPIETRTSPYKRSDL